MTIDRPPAIEVKGLRKSFGDNVVLDGVDLHVTEGTIFALLGPNGAGKTTTVHILSTLVPAGGGEVLIVGHDVVREADAVRQAIGVTGQFSAVDDLLTGEETCCSWPTCTTWRERKAGAGRPSCWNGSSWQMRPRRHRSPTPAGCDASWTWR